MKVWALTEEFSEGKYLVVRRDGTIPEWQHFVMGSFDPCVPEALRAYANEAERRDYDHEFVQSVRELAANFEAVAAGERARKVANPTSAPHRVDNDLVVRLMGRKLTSALIEVRQERAGERPDEV